MTLFQFAHNFAVVGSSLGPVNLSTLAGYFIENPEPRSALIQHGITKPNPCGRRNCSWAFVLILGNLNQWSKERHTSCRRHHPAEWRELEWY